jgi:hypothetical protein
MNVRRQPVPVLYNDDVKKIHTRVTSRKTLLLAAEGYLPVEFALLITSDGSGAAEMHSLEGEGRVLTSSSDSC